MTKKRAIVALLVIAALGVGTAAVALAWKPEAHSNELVGPFACDRGIGMWMWGISSDGTSGHGPMGGSEQVPDPYWEEECGEHLRVIQIVSVTGAGLGVVSFAGAIAVAIAGRRRKAPDGFDQPSSAKTSVPQK